MLNKLILAALLTFSLHLFIGFQRSSAEATTINKVTNQLLVQLNRKP